MGVFVVDTDVLARARFGTSQLAESLGGLRILHDPRTLPWHRAWRDRHRAAYLDYLRADPVAEAIAAHAFSPSWTADFLTVPPARPDLTLDEELVELESRSDRRVRADLERVRAPLAAPLSATGLGKSAADLLRWVWRTTIEPEWPRRRTVLRADFVSRTSRLSSEGWSGVLAEMRPGLRWLGQGEMQINEAPYPPRDIRGRDLIFIAAHCAGGWVSWKLPSRFAIIYPVTGVFADTSFAAPDSLSRLLGPARARVLEAAARPVSTSALVATTGMPLATVGTHLKVLLDAGLLQRRRSGREVLYWWSGSAHELVAGARS